MVQIAGFKSYKEPKLKFERIRVSNLSLEVCSFEPLHVLLLMLKLKRVLKADCCIMNRRDYGSSLL